MGSDNSKQTDLQLSPVLREKALKIFKEIDVDGSKTIDKEETIKWWATNFARVNTVAMFDAVDVDGDGHITQDEWLEFWAEVSSKGYDDEELIDELDQLADHGSWVKFEKVPHSRRLD